MALTMNIFVWVSVMCLFIGGVSSFSLSPIIAPRSDGVKDPVCRKQSDAYATALKNFTLWAAQMYDASAKLPHGILTGNAYQLGSFDECLGIHVDLGSQNGGTISGQYCLVRLQLGTDSPHSPPHTELAFDPFGSAWDVIRPSGEPTIFLKNLIYWGVCVPAACDRDDIQAEVDLFFRQNYGDKISATVDARNCQTSASIAKDSTASSLDRVTYNLFITLFLLVGASSVYDFALANGLIKATSAGFLMKSFRCFSLYISVPDLLYPKKSNSGLDVLTGSRAILSVFVIYGHRWRMQITYPLIYITAFEQKIRSFNFLTNCLLVINAFFAISGFLTGYFFYAALEKQEKTGSLKPSFILSAIINRVLRFTPAYIAVILLYLTVFPKISDGPLWPSTVLEDVKRCEENWWTNLLFINNFYRADRMCMFQSWYLSTDLQLFSLSLVVVYIYKKNRRLGRFLIWSFGTICIVSLGIMLYINDADAFLYLSPKQMRDIPNVDFYLNYYIPVYVRLPCYFIGVFYGLRARERKNIPSKISKIMVDVISLILILLIISIEFYGSSLMVPSPLRDSSILRALYGTLSGPVCAICSILIIYLTVRKPGGLIENIFTLYPFMFMSKYSFLVYLLHPIFQIMESGGLRNAVSPSRQDEYWKTAGDIVYVHMFAFVLGILVDVPFGKISQLIFSVEKTNKFEGENGEVKKEK